MKKKKQNGGSAEQLEMWQKRLEDGCAAFSGELAKMDDREKIYLGEKKSIDRLFSDDLTTSTPYVRNMAFELIETEVDNDIIYPKVTAMRKGDETLAHLIEDMIRGELDRLKMEYFNDQMERTVHIQGGGIWNVEWDSTAVSHERCGEVALSVLHPKSLVPQPGVYSGIDDMDWVILRVPTTKERILAQFGVDVSAQQEAAPEIKTADGEDASEDSVTLEIGYEKNADGTIASFLWVNDTVIRAEKNCQARRLRRCKKCGAPDIPGGQELGRQSEDGNYPLIEDVPISEQPLHSFARGACRYCGSTEFESSEEEYEERYEKIVRSDGTVLFEGAGVESREAPGELTRTLGSGEAAYIPYYQPKMYPVILQKNISVHGRVMGISDVDMIKDQQNATNRLFAKAFEKILQSGSYITLPQNANIKIDSREGKQIRIKNAADKSLIGTYDMEQNITSDLSMAEIIYNDARHQIGVTDSYQGRKDATATSGKAKQISVSQSSGRLESKRVMKQEAWSRLFELIFKYRLAYCDEVRPVRQENRATGEEEYGVFNRFDFLERDENGEFWWNDLFEFSADVSSPLEKDRQALWQETRMNLQQGAYGDPQSPNTLKIFWRHMEKLHYPNAGETLRYMEQLAQSEEQAKQEQQMMLQQAMAQQGAKTAPASQAEEQMPQEAQQSVPGGGTNGDSAMI